MLERLLFWFAIAAELGIWAFVFAYTWKYAIPWDDIRAKRELRRMLLARLPVVRARIERLLGRAARPPSADAVRSRVLRRVAEAMTLDVVRFAGLCMASLDTVERHLRTHPREMALIEADVSSTLDTLERMLRMRDETVPETDRGRREDAAAIVEDLGSFRDRMAEMVEEFHDKGHHVGHERACLARMANAIAAARGSAAWDPDGVFEAAPRQLARVRELAEAAAFRAVVEEHVRATDDKVTERAARARTRLAVLRAAPRTPKPGEAWQQVRAEHAAEALLERAENHVRAAIALCGEECRDRHGETAARKRLKDALLAAERASAFVAAAEEDLARQFAARPDLVGN